MRVRVRAREKELTGGGNVCLSNLKVCKRVHLRVLKKKNKMLRMKAHSVRHYEHKCSLDEPKIDAHKFHKG